MKVLVTGARGQVGSAVTKRCLASGFHVVAVGRQELDIVDETQVAKTFATEKPDVIIHCAAYTNVDQAESEPVEAFKVNAVGTRNLVTAARLIDAKFVYVSTDYVFDGTTKKPLDEKLPTCPLGVYGQSKRAGETAVQELHTRFYIVRTSWVYGHQGSNFVKTMVKLSKSNQEIKVVADQVGSPTYAEDLAETILELIKTERYGTYHVSNSGACSWYEFAKKIFELAGQDVTVNKCTTAEFPRPAQRPAYSVFDHRALRENGFKPMRSWQEALLAYFKNEKRRRSP